MIIAIDGPAASGKGTLARRIADELGYHCLDTGLLYRAVARDVAARGVGLEDTWAAVAIARGLDPASLCDPALRGPPPARQPRSSPASPRSGRRCSSTSARSPVARRAPCSTGATSARSCVRRPT